MIKNFKQLTFILFSLFILVMISSCSLFRRASRPTADNDGDYYDKEWRNEYDDDSFWQTYDWHAETDTLRLREIADSLIALGEAVPADVARKLNRSKVSAGGVPQICYDVVDVAKQYIGCKYVWGANGPRTFDCSGLTCYVFNQFGIKLGRVAGAQYAVGTHIYDTRDLRAGDLVFWKGRSLRRNEIGHVGICISTDPETGVFTFVHAALTGVQIDRSDMDYYAVRYIGATRILE